MGGGTTKFARNVLASGAAALIGSGCGDDRPSSEADFLVGMCHAATPEMVALAQGAGANSVRNSLVWRRAEPEPGALRVPAAYRRWIDAVVGRGMVPLIPFGYSNRHYDGGGYPESAEAVAAYGRFGGFVAAATAADRPILEIWNEWNLGIGMPSWAGRGAPESYVAAQRAAYFAIREARPDAFVLGGVMAGAGLTDDWTRRACEAGMLAYLDGLAFHPYSFWMQVPGSMPERGMMFMVDELEKLLAEFPGGDAVPFYLTEIGWSTHRGPDRVTHEEQADYAARMLLLTRAHPRIRGVWWFNLKNRPDRPSDVNYHFGLLQSDGRPKSAWFAFRDTARLVREAGRAERIGSLPDSVRGVQLWLRGGERALALWTLEPGAEARFVVRGGWRGRTTARVAGQGRARGIGSVSPVDGAFEIVAGNRPVLVRALRGNFGAELASPQSARETRD